MGLTVNKDHTGKKQKKYKQSIHRATCVCTCLSICVWGQGIDHPDEAAEKSELLYPVYPTGRRVSSSFITMRCNLNFSIVCVCEMQLEKLIFTEPY